MTWRELPISIKVCIVLTVFGMALQGIAAFISLAKALL